MPEKEWEIFLPDGSRIIVFMNRNRSYICSFVVALISLVNDREECITRYDTAHGQSHRDVLGKKAGLIEKNWLLTLNDKEVFEYAIKDLKENYESYIQFFCEH